MPVNVFTTLDDPLATNGTDAFGINAMGQIVGLYEDASGNHGFLYGNGTYTTLDDPLASPGGDGTSAFGINDLGQIVGSYSNASGNHGFVLSGGTYTTLDDPLATRGTFAQGITTRARSSGITPTPVATTASSTTPTAALTPRSTIRWPQPALRPSASITMARS